VLARERGDFLRVALRLRRLALAHVALLGRRRARPDLPRRDAAARVHDGALGDDGARLDDRAFEDNRARADDGAVTDPGGLDERAGACKEERGWGGVGWGGVGWGGVGWGGVGWEWGGSE
jgi:hypothetical protein